MEKFKISDFKSGLIGEIISAISPLIESNSESLLIQLLTCFGGCLGPTSYFYAAEDKHHANLFVTLVGRSARGRKGQSLNMIKEIFRCVDPDWSQNHIKKGLSSGEGLIHHVRDESVMDNQTGVNILLGTGDKRLLCVESEFSSALKVTQRDGNILSQILRDAWDSTDLQTLTKHDPLIARAPHISIIGHITFAEMIKYLNSTEINNGLGNRFIFIKAETNKKLPFAQPIDADVKVYLANQIKLSLDKAKQIGVIEFSSEASKYWEIFYRNISDNDETIVGALTARQAAQVRRLAMIISLFNSKSEIDLDSLKFAESIYEYSICTLKEIYGHTTGDPLTDKIYDLLKSSPDSLSRSFLSEKLSRNYPKSNMDRSLKLLLSQGLIVSEKQATNGRPQENFRISI